MDAVLLHVTNRGRCGISNKPFFPNKLCFDNLVLDQIEVLKTFNLFKGCATLQSELLLPPPCHFKYYETSKSVTFNAALIKHCL